MAAKKLNFKPNANKTFRQKSSFKQQFCPTKDDIVYGKAAILKQKENEKRLCPSMLRKKNRFGIYDCIIMYDSNAYPYDLPKSSIK